MSGDGAAGEPFRDFAFRPGDGLAGQSHRARKLALGHQVIDRAACQAGQCFDFRAAKVFVCHVVPLGVGWVMAARCIGTEVRTKCQL